MPGTDTASQADSSTSSPVAFLDVQQAAVLLAIPTAAVYALIANGTLPATRLSKNRTRIPAAGLAAVLRERTTGGVPPPKIEPPAVPPADGTMTKAERHIWNGGPEPSPRTVLPAGMSIVNGEIRW